MNRLPISSTLIERPIKINKGVRERRLTKLAEVLKLEKRERIAIPGDRTVLFDLGSFGVLPMEGQREFHVRDKTIKVKEDICYSTACAAGTAGLMPEFRKIGFRLMTGNPGDVVDVEYRFTAKGLEYRYTNFAASELFFHLRMAEAYYLFNPESYRDGDNTTAKSVARRILDLLKGKTDFDGMKAAEQYSYLFGEGW